MRLKHLILCRLVVRNIPHNTLHTRLDTTGRGTCPANRQSRRVEANVGDYGSAANYGRDWADLKTKGEPNSARKRGGLGRLGG